MGRKGAWISIHFACLAVLSTALAGCQTTNQRPRPSVVNKPAPASDQALPADIREILSAGGLDAANPSAPTNRPTMIAAADIPTMPVAPLVSAPPVPPTRQVITAARGEASSGSAASVVKGTSEQPAADMSQALANLSQTRTAPAVTVVEHLSSYAAAERQAPEIIPSINMATTTARAVPQKPRPQMPDPVQTASRQSDQTKKHVRRF